MPLAEPTPERIDLVLRWTPQRARAGELLHRLGLAEPAIAVDAADFGQTDHHDALERAKQAVLAPMRRRVLAWSDEELVDFLGRLHEGRHDRFNALLIVMPDCALAAQSERSRNAREWIAAVLRPECTPKP